MSTARGQCIVGWIGGIFQRQGVLWTYAQFEGGLPKRWYCRCILNGSIPRRNIFTPYKQKTREYCPSGNMIIVQLIPCPQDYSTTERRPHFRSHIQTAPQQNLNTTKSSASRASSPLPPPCSLPSRVGLALLACPAGFAGILRGLIPVLLRWMSSWSRR